MIRDFTDHIQNEELLRLPLPGTTIDPIKPDSNSSQDPVYYLDKRLFMDNDINNNFLHLYHEEGVASFQWKVKCQWNVFSLANDPAWTLQKGPWVDDF